jgi:outer membrane receptor protein involved in Fe transport
VRTVWGALALSASAAWGQAPEIELDAGAAPVDAAAAQPTQDVTELSFDDLINTPIAVVTRSARSSRETPGVVTVVSREEIAASGARDLLEVLQLVPGFSFHTDTIGAVGVGFRGMWGHEGKVLLLIDGIEMNELLYSTTQFGNHYPVALIERVEVIRGPGSAIFGGFAELAVINVITHGARDLQGVSASGRVSVSTHALQDATLGVSGGYAFENGLEVAVNAATGVGLRGDGTYTDFAGATFDQRTQPLDPLLVTLGIKVKGLSVHLIYDDYRMGARDGYGIIPADATTPQRFRTLAADARYRFDAGDKVSITPYANWSYQVPWEVPDPSNSLYYTKTAQRLRAGVLAEYSPLDNLHLLLGAEGYVDMAWLNDTNLVGTQTQFHDANGNAVNSISYDNVAVYAQVLWDTPYVDVAVGGRFEWNSAVGANVAPRIALVKAFDHFHIKALYSGAFRSPGFEDINLQPAGNPLRAEQMQIAEGELGVHLFDLLSASVNGFYMRLQNPIIYGIDPVAVLESYFNDVPEATYGGEVNVAVRGRYGFLNLTYSLALPSEAGPATYQVPGQSGNTLGFAAHKVTATGKMRVWRGLHYGGSAVFFSQRWGYLTPSGMFDSDGNPVPTLGQLPATLNINLWVGYDDLVLKGLNVSAGISNLANTPTAFEEPYNGGHAPLYGLSRAFYLRLSYAWRADR